MLTAVAFVRQVFAVVVTPIITETEYWDAFAIIAFKIMSSATCTHTHTHTHTHTLTIHHVLLSLHFISASLSLSEICALSIVIFIAVTAVNATYLENTAYS